MKILKNKKVFIPLLVLVLLVSIIGISYSTLLYDDELVLQNTDLTYYLDVYYDGVDKDGVKSSDTMVSNVSIQEGGAHDVILKDINVNLN